jgi:hypothetical protein
MIKESYKTVDINKLRRLQNSLGFLDNFDISGESFEKAVVLDENQEILQEETDLLNELSQINHRRKEIINRLMDL